MIDRRVDISHIGKVWIVLAGLAAILYVLWQLSNSIAGGSFRTALLLGAAFAAFFIGGRIADDWRSGVYFFLVWLLFEDLVRKYMGNSMYVYFGKDVLVGVTYAAFLVARTRRDTVLFRPPFRNALVMFFLLGLVQVFNPLSPSIFYGLLGLKLDFYYIPLMFVGYGMLRKENDLRRFLVVSMVLAAVISLVGILQAIVGLDFLNPHGGADIELLGHLVRSTPSGLAVLRPPSVFVSDGRFGQYIILSFILGLGAAGYLLLRTRRGRKTVLPAVGLVALAGVLSGSRGAFVYIAASALVLSAAMLWGAPRGLGEGYRLVKALRRSLIFVALAMALAAIIFPDVIGAHWAFYQETVMPGSEHYEVGIRTWDYPMAELKKAFADPDWAMGHGIGTASLGGQYVSRIMEVAPSNIWVENGYGNLIVELGILGPILWLIWASSLVFAALKTTLRLKGTWAFPVAFSVLWYAFLMLFPFTWGGFMAYQNFVCNAYFWLLVGILFRLPELVNQNANEPEVTSARAR
jgi:branched-subunit amino acid transport protein